MEVTEKRFESDIEAAFLSPAGGYIKGTDTYDPNLGLYVSTLIQAWSLSPGDSKTSWT